MGFSWAVVAFLLGGIPELIGNIWPNSVTSAVDIWPAALAVPAFFGGAGFYSSSSCREKCTSKGSHSVASQYSVP